MGDVNPVAANSQQHTTNPAPLTPQQQTAYNFVAADAHYLMTTNPGRGNQTEALALLFRAIDRGGLSPVETDRLLTLSPGLKDNADVARTLGLKPADIATFRAGSFSTPDQIIQGDEVRRLQQFVRTADNQRSGPTPPR